ncbi:TonB-dependent receptor [Nannocystis bainbridge]|uniref:TonB-dependent receptor n=1 Tax=Nannocystis bainbridge TaxID=2995303 RepID=A0ABT5E7H6_9BACT|nr:TonB-dependent receptor [Nannocystis bainbridge]MDC0721804.1 TonB-dependent receptor [Nannocystis bainbridge]
MIALGLYAVLAAADPAPVERPARDRVQGLLRSAGERQPVAGARVFATARRGPAWKREAVSDRDGVFVLADLPSRDFVLTVVAAGHQRFEQPTTAPYWSRRKPPTIYLQPQGAGGYRTIVEQQRTTRPSTVSTRLQPEEIANLPGSQGDPLRALQNLPGVARIPGGLGLIVLRGAAPNQSQVFFGEHPLPRAFHVPGLASVVQTGVLQGLEYVPGNFSAHYGNAVGGVVHLTPRVGRRDGLHGHAKLDITSVGALLEGPFGKGGSFLLAAQRGYLDLALKALPDDVLNGDALQPRYHDYQFIFDHPVGRGGTLTVRLIGASDDLRIVSGGLPNFRLRTAFDRVDLAYRKRHGRWDFLLAPAVRFDRSDFSARVFTRRNNVVGLLRAEASVRPLRPLQLTLGFDTQLDRYKTRQVTAPPQLPEEDVTARGLLTTSGLYLSSQLDLGRYAVVAGVRVNAFTAAENALFTADPRLLLRYSPHERVRFQLGAGMYSQPSLRRSLRTAGFTYETMEGGPAHTFGNVILPGAARFLDPQLEFQPGRRVGASQATQYSANLHVDLTAALDLDATIFYRRVRDHLPPDPDDPELPDTASSTHGVELMLRHDLTARLFGWIAYTWMRSDAHRLFPDGTIARAPADFDQRHNLVMLVGYKLPRRWSIAARFRLVTGLPFTPYVGGLNHQGEDTYPIAGPPNSGRMPVFHQLDLRLDRTWILHRCIVGAYLDVQNVYNRPNAEGLMYSHDYASTRAVVGVPILPVLGVKVSY